MRALNSVGKNGYRVDKELKCHALGFNWDGLSYPVMVEGILEFGNGNNVGINLIGLVGNVITALKSTTTSFEKLEAFRICTQCFAHEDIPTSFLDYGYNTRVNLRREYIPKKLRKLRRVTPPPPPIIEVQPPAPHLLQCVWSLTNLQPNWSGRI